MECEHRNYNGIPGDDWCDTHERPHDSCLLANLYKVIVGGDTADNAIDTLFSDDMYFRQTRTSSIVVYLSLSNEDAIELATRPDFEVTRAPSNWSI